jgi:hypothetical protein
MKKITNNSKFGKLSIILNLLILVFFIISMVFILKFDEVNVKFVAKKPEFEKARENLREVEQPRRRALAEVEHYQVRLDSLVKKAVPTDAKLRKEYEENLKRVREVLPEKKAQLASIDSLIGVEQLFFEPIQTVYSDLENTTNQAKSRFNLFIWITVALVFVKILVFGYWKYRNIINLRNATPWMKKGVAPFWGIVGWLIPGYNLIKPYSVFAEIWNETEYILKDKEILPKNSKNNNGEFNIGIWWGLLIITMVIMTWILRGTFFGQSAMFYKLSHQGVAIAAIICWAVYLLWECVLIRRYNKMNHLLVANQNKFE